MVIQCASLEQAHHTFDSGQQVAAAPGPVENSRAPPQRSLGHISMANDGITEVANKGQQQLIVIEGNTKAFEFLKLPPEIRNKIYRNALVEKRDCYFFFSPPLTLVNKQIRSESLPVLYGNNKFSICCFEGFPSDFPWKFPQLQSRWETPIRVPAVSTVSSFAYVTELDAQYAFWNGEYPGSCVYIDICMRNKEPYYAGLDNYRMISRPQMDRKSNGDIWRICHDLLAHSASKLGWHGDDPLIEWVLKDLEKVIESLLFFAEKCPAAAEWVWVVVEAKDIDGPEYCMGPFDEEFWDTADSTGSGSQGPGSEGFDSEGGED